MQCSSCGAQNPDNNRFCMQCGQQMPPAQQPGVPPNLGVPPNQGTPPGWSAPTQSIPQPGYVPPVPPPGGTQQQPVYQQPYGAGHYQQQQGQAAVKKGRSGMKMFAGALAFIAGAVVVVSTFLAWFSTLTGWSFMLHAAEVNSASGGSATANFLFAYGQGKFLFTGFWSLLFGGLIVVAAILFFAGLRTGRALVVIFGVLATAIAVVNIVEVYSTGGPSAGVNPGVGLWLFAGVGVVSFIAGLL